MQPKIEFHTFHTLTHNFPLLILWIHKLHFTPCLYFQFSDFTLFPFLNIFFSYSKSTNTQFELVENRANSGESDLSWTSLYFSQIQFVHYPIVPIVAKKVVKKNYRFVFILLIRCFDTSRFFSHLQWYSKYIIVLVNYRVMHFNIYYDNKVLIRLFLSTCIK